MDFNFSCPFCNQDLTTDEASAGSEIECPACNEMLIIPTPDQGRGEAAGGREERNITLPTKATTAKIMKPSKPLDVAARGDRKMRLKSIRRGECLKDGKDQFDETVSEFLQKIGEGNIVSVHTVQYTLTAQDAPAGSPGQVDYGVVVIYKA